MQNDTTHHFRHLRQLVFVQRTNKLKRFCSVYTNRRTGTIPENNKRQRKEETLRYVYIQRETQLYPLHKPLILNGSDIRQEKKEKIRSLI